MNKESWVGMLVTLAVVVAGGVAWYEHTQQPEPVIAPARQAQVAAPPKSEPSEPDFPVPDAPPVPDQPLPDLERSDAPLHDALATLFGEAPVDAYLVPTEIIKRIVAAVDNLDRDALPARLRPVPAFPGHLTTQGSGAGLAISEVNSNRYAPFVAAIQAADMQMLASLYFWYYPLFQKAYEELGYPKRYFNDRLVKTLDNLLAAPVPEAPIALAEPKVLFEYADPDLESRSYGQKAMMRLGAQNELAVKAKLRELRADIAARKS